MSPTTSACLRRRRLLAVAAASLLALPLGVQAQDYPARPIRLVVPFPPVGPPTCSPASSPRSYDAIADFAPVSNLADVPLVLAVHPKLSARSVKDLVALAKSSKPPLAFASAGNATSQHLSGEAFKMAADVDMLHVPYKGSAPALTDLIGGHVQLMFDSLPSSMPHLKAGTIRPLAVTTPKRSSALPEVPTVAESGYPGFAMSTWYGVWAPALAQVGLRLEQIDVIELNEAFAAQGLAVLRQLGLPDDDPRVNAWGGAIALGHPLGASGARLATTAVNRLHETGGRYAIAMMCIGVGQGIAVVMERT